MRKASLPTPHSREHPQVPRLSKPGGHRSVPRPGTVWAPLGATPRPCSPSWALLGATSGLVPFDPFWHPRVPEVMSLATPR